jgi:hypothetical protein
MAFGEASCSRRFDVSHSGVINFSLDGSWGGKPLESTGTKKAATAGLVESAPRCDLSMLARGERAFGPQRREERRLQSHRNFKTGTWQDDTERGAGAGTVQGDRRFARNDLAHLRVLTEGPIKRRKTAPSELERPTFVQTGSSPATAPHELTGHDAEQERLNRDVLSLAEVLREEGGDPFAVLARAYRARVKAKKGRGRPKNPVLPEVRAIETVLEHFARDLGKMREGQHFGDLSPEARRSWRRYGAELFVAAAQEKGLSVDDPRVRAHRRWLALEDERDRRRTSGEAMPEKDHGVQVDGEGELTVTRIESYVARNAPWLRDRLRDK